jgi:hypothetical protein
MVGICIAPPWHWLSAESLSLGLTQTICSYIDPNHF